MSLISPLEFLRYRIARARSPELHRLGILEGGVGIRARAQKLRREWEAHLTNTKDVINSWTDEIGESELLLLGAGTGLDFDVKSAVQRFRQITAVDADPLVRRFWERQIRSSDCKIIFRHAEITGCLTHWLRRLDTALGQISLTNRANSWAAAIQAIAEIPRHTEATPGLQASRNTCIISLNLLSQLPLCWQHAVEQTLVSKFGQDWVLTHEQSYLLAAKSGGEALVLQHLAALSRSNAGRIIIISDLEYLFYRPKLEQALAQPDLEWISENTEATSLYEYRGDWNLRSVSSESLEIEAMSAVSGVDFYSHEYLRELFFSFDFLYGRPWVWRIAPLGCDPHDPNTKREGELHLVAPILLRSSS